MYNSKAVKSSVFAGIFIAGLSISCEKKNDPNAGGCTVSKESVCYGTFTYTYGSDGKLSSTATDPLPSHQVIYDSKGNIIQFRNQKYFYDLNNHLLKGEFYDIDGLSLLTTFTYEYNSVWQLIKKSNYTLLSGNLKLYQYCTYTYSNLTSLNPTMEMVYKSDGTLYQTATYEYDNHPSPYSGRHEIWVVLGSALNNVVKSTVTFEDNKNTGVPPFTEVFSHVYNNKGYPISTQNSEGGMCTQYTYNCN